MSDVEQIGMHEEALRARALSKLRKRRDFRLHLSIYVLVNMLLIVVWAITGGPFWPAFPILGWGLGVMVNAWDVYWRRAISEAEIQKEIERVRAGQLR